MPIAKALPRVETIIFGPADSKASINMKTLVVGEQPPGYDVGDAHHHILMSILMAARPNDKQALDGPFLPVRDTDALGFDGKWALHPDQIDAANEMALVNIDKGRAAGTTRGSSLAPSCVIA
jgi:citrate lyase subunit beta/citryl-CoA lyase